MSENQNPSTPTPPEATSPAAEDVRYAAYDKTYLRFVDGVFDTKAKATAAARKAKVKSYEIREV